MASSIHIKSKKGFVLPELLLSIVIFSMVITSLLLFMKDIAASKTNEVALAREIGNLKAQLQNISIDDFIINAIHPTPTEDLFEHPNCNPSITNIQTPELAGLCKFLSPTIQRIKSLARTDSPIEYSHEHGLKISINTSIVSCHILMALDMGFSQVTSSDPTIAPNIDKNVYLDKATEFKSAVSTITADFCDKKVTMYESGATIHGESVDSKFVFYLRN